MSGARVEVIGDKALSATLAIAAHRLGDMSGPGRAAASTVYGSARSRTPVRTGRLAGSLTRAVSDTEAVVSSGLVYAPVIHFGWRRHHIRPHPFLYSALDDTEPVVVRGYETRVQQVLAGVHGAA